MHAERVPPTIPICELGGDCAVALAPENDIPARLLLLVRSQAETRWNGEMDVEIDLNHMALWKAIEKFPGGVEDEWGMFNRVLRAWRVIKHRQEHE
jgi:hypothetical protein